MSIAKIQSGDNVKVISGNYKGIVGIVTKVVKKTKPNGKLMTRVAINSIPKIAKYRKSQTFQGQNYPGAILQADRTVDISNISLINSDNKVSKVKIEVENGKKVRKLKKTGEIVIKTKIEKKAKISDTSALELPQVEAETKVEESKVETKSKKSPTKKTKPSEK